MPNKMVSKTVDPRNDGPGPRTTIGQTKHSGDSSPGAGPRGRKDTSPSSAPTVHPGMKERKTPT